IQKEIKSICATTGATPADTTTGATAKTSVLTARNARLKRPALERPALERLALTKPSFWSSPPVMLLRLTLRQSRTVLLCGLGLAIALDACPFLRESWNPFDFAHRGFPFLLVIAVAFVLLFAWAGPFRQDWKNDSFRILSRYGIAPGTVWWARVLPFLCVYLIPLPFFTILAVETSSPGKVGENLSMLLFAYGTPFFVGILTSHCFKSVVFGAVSVVYSCFLYFVALVLQGEYGFNPLWTTAPLPLFAVLASRLRTRDWLREHVSWKTRLRTLGLCLAPLPVVLVAIPFVRVCSVPVVDEYHVDDILAGTPYDRLQPLTAEILPLDSFPGRPDATYSMLYEGYFQNSADGLPREPGFIRVGNYWNYVSTRYAYSGGPGNTQSNFATLVHQTLHYARLKQEAKADVAKRGLKKQLAFLREPASPSALVRLATLYRHERQTLNFDWPNGILGNYHLPPWENAIRYFQLSYPGEHTRANRLLDYRFQTLCRQAEEMEKAIRTNTGDISAIFRNGPGYDDLRTPVDDFYMRHTVLGSPVDRAAVTAEGIFIDEIRRRARIIEIGLVLWRCDHDTLPESLDELVGDYLEEIPKLPFDGGAFEYLPPGSEAAKNYPNLGSNTHLHGRVIQGAIVPEKGETVSQSVFLRSGGLFWELDALRLR
ncbi:MAG TPA: hypothetical protein DEB39_08270, partial [Planctomycetaceae bacterium]|nr:hypothetical protein [Planctomycetaceae bacterium]